MIPLHSRSVLSMQMFLKKGMECGDLFEIQLSDRSSTARKSIDKKTEYTMRDLMILSLFVPCISYIQEEITLRVAYCHG